jgi:hypothetical protein
VYRVTETTEATRFEGANADLQASNIPPPNEMHRQNSGLESMQSIEQALGNVQHLGNAEQNFIMDKVRDDWNQQMMTHPHPQGTPIPRQ